MGTYQVPLTWPMSLVWGDICYISRHRDLNEELQKAYHRKFNTGEAIKCCFNMFRPSANATVRNAH